jgi:hypothetical protein
VVLDRCVLAGDEGLAGEELVLHDLHDLLCSRVGDVHRTSDGAGPTKRDGGGRGGASVFPARGWRTWIDRARMSTVGMWRCDCST